MAGREKFGLRCEYGGEDKGGQIYDHASTVGISDFGTSRNRMGEVICRK